MHTAWGGSTIEQWLDNETIATCKNATLSSSNGEWHETRVLPFVNVTLKGWVWYQGMCLFSFCLKSVFRPSVLPLSLSLSLSRYLSISLALYLSISLSLHLPHPHPHPQPPKLTPSTDNLRTGENDMHGTFGNSALGYGYACLMPKLVATWRKMWSAEPGTTDPMAPFGLVTLAPSGTEGGNDIGTMRLAQTASYGVLPNPAMPNTFLAQAYDLNDPFSNTSCYNLGCCPNNYKPGPKGCDGCDAYCESANKTNWVSFERSERYSCPDRKTTPTDRYTACDNTYMATVHGPHPSSR